MPRRTHYARLQKVEWRSGACLCQSARVLTCTKAIEAYDRGELIAEPCPAGCPPEARLTVVMRLSPWRNGAECACPTCAPKRSTALALQTLNGAPQSDNEAHAAAQQDTNRTTDPVSGEAETARGSDAAAPDRPEAHPDAARAPAPVYAPEEGSGDVVLGGRAKDAVLELGRTALPVATIVATAPPTLVSPLALEMRQEAATRARMLSEAVLLGVPWWLPVEPAQLGPCAALYCEHPAVEHRAVRTGLACRYCGFRADQHRADGLALEVPWAARRSTPCSLYRSINLDEADASDKCEHPGCPCRAWRRWIPRDPHSELAALKDQLAEKDRIAAEQAEELERVRAQLEQLRADALRAQGRTSLGPAPHGTPVHTDDWIE